ncbi:hypothetical protein J1N35_033366 [Gossypium stocksii]|uniref:WAT1-related protein n=1 Tax=Gossypium stocksii TaxID=47602 RepID=A0A9D3UQ91_9ROSI|nr:hypothetical protein J1N35_033366 [Gossypium stocksii]
MGDQTPFSALSNVWDKVKPFLAIVSLQFGYAGMYIISLVSLKQGMSNFILCTYRHVVATIVIAPFAFILESTIRRKGNYQYMLTKEWKWSLLIVFYRPVLDQNLYHLGMMKTTATYSSAFVNMLPAITFILAMIFRLEKINLKKIYSVAKIIGTAITVVGAMVMTLYKGPIVDFIKSGGVAHHGNITESADKHWVTGIITLLILHVEDVPNRALSYSLEGLSLIMARGPGAWKLGWDSRLLAAAYSERGLVFLTSFSLLCMIITAALGTFVLAEKVYFGRVDFSILGAIITVSGL